MPAEVGHGLADLPDRPLGVEAAEQLRGLVVVLRDLPVKEVWDERQVARLGELLAVPLHDLVQAVPLVDHDECPCLGRAFRLAQRSFELSSCLHREAYLSCHSALSCSAHHHGTGPRASKNPPVGPASSRSASFTDIAAPSALKRAHARP